ncbi:MAG: translocation/assembly module TamB domain-containing protein, partial [Mesorhizobium sp.]|nr:translocation/assembly module TamB domain-containing protein [Mesorhizobium sp.]
ITIKGPLLSTPVLAGRIDLGRTVITLPEKLPGALTKLNVQHKNASGAVDAQAEAMKPAQASGGGGGLTLDLIVDAPSQIFVQGRGLDAELGGTIRLTGSTAAPQATGLFTLRRGRFSILGRRLDFTRGTLGFAGSLVPTIDFEATSSVNSSTVTVTVSGEASDPKFAFSSSPSAPEDEVLAQLVFGRSMSSLSPMQIAQLAEAAAQLAGVGGPTSLLDTLRGKLGVDDLDVKTDEKTGDTSVSVGKYLNDRTYVTIEKGSNPGSGKAAIDLNIGKGVKLRGEAADDGSTKGGIFFEKEY